jgi:diacylglycerol kinase (ATP)
MNSERFSLKSRLRSFRFALSGLRSLLKYEHNSRIHLIAAVLAIILGVLLKLSPSEWTLLIILIGFVFITELLNSSIESLCDHTDPEKNELIRKAKDYSAAAVLVSALVAVVAGCLIFIPKIICLFSASRLCK